MKKIFKLKGVLQNYDWGGTEYIADLLNESKSNKKLAEYWMGAHEKASSSIIADDQLLPLDQFLDSNLSYYLGEKVAANYGRLPYLFKVLDVNSMLSIQVHPNKAAAEAGYLRENNLGVAKNSSNRNFKDDNHKPEIMVALSDFWLLHGFLSEDKLLKVLESVPEFKHFISVFQKGGYKSLYKKVMEESPQETNNTVQPIIDRILPDYHAGKFSKLSADYWACKAYLKFCNSGEIDKGIYSLYFFNIVQAKCGEAVYQGAGIPHAYLEGQNIELMANSDNVLRGGLTSKYVDVEELLKHIDFSATIPHLIKGDNQTNELERVYKSPAPDFELSRIELSTQRMYQSLSSSTEIIIVMEGDASLEGANHKLLFNKGEVMLITAGCKYQITTSTDAVLYKAATP